MNELLQKLREAAKAAQPDSESTLEAFLYIWISGGWAMIVLASIALFIFVLGFHVFFRLRRKGFRGIDEAKWRRWIHEPEDRTGPVGGLFDEVSRLTCDESVQVSEAFDWKVSPAELTSSSAPMGPKPVPVRATLSVFLVPGR